MNIKRITALTLLIVSFAACQNKQQRPDNSLDTGRAFIRASLDGDFKTARDLLIPDSANRELFDSYEDYYGKLPQDRKENYRKASYEINKITEANDSTVTINYSNSYMHEPMEIRLVRRTGVWMVDFEYMYAADTTGK
jgi:hypothetical protein